jgi:hypothetical protein
MRLQNTTPFVVSTALALDRNAAETLAIVVKGTYQVRNNVVRLAELQEPIAAADVYRGEPAKSSLLKAGERMLHKAATDVVLIGNAYADRRDCRQVDVSLRIGPIAKVVRVLGDRVWVSGAGTVPSHPARFDKIPLVYERAFGGVDESVGERMEENPVGVGFRGRGSKVTLAGTPLPNLEDPRQPIRDAKDRPPPVGFGFVAPFWKPRRAYAGTYGPEWLEKQAPLLPADYDERYQQVAPADQIWHGFMVGGEKVDIVNASPSGRLSFTLAAPTLRVELQISGDPVPLPVNLDTVVVDGDRESFSMTWRGNRSVHGQVHDIEVVRVEAERVE